MPAPLEIRSSTNGAAFPAFGALIGAAIFGFYGVQAMAGGAQGGKAVLLLACAAGCVGLGLYMARGATDTGVQVVLDEKGFRDRRGGDVLVPWDEVACVQLVHGNHGGPALVNFTLLGELPHDIKFAPSQALSLALPFVSRNTVHMEVASLDIDPETIIQAVKRLAPKVKVVR